MADGIELLKARDQQDSHGPGHRRQTARKSETFSINLNSTSNATLTDGQGQGTIVHEEPRINSRSLRSSDDNVISHCGWHRLPSV